MRARVGIAELRQNLSFHLRRVAEGERLVVTDRNRPVAELGPITQSGSALERLVDRGRVLPPRRTVLPDPLEMTGDPEALGQALAEVRDDR